MDSSIHTVDVWPILLHLFLSVYHTLCLCISSGGSSDVCLSLHWSALWPLQADQSLSQTICQKVCSLHSSVQHYTSSYELIYLTVIPLLHLFFYHSNPVSYIIHISFCFILFRVFLPPFSGWGILGCGLMWCRGWCWQPSSPTASSLASPPSSWCNGSRGSTLEILPVEMIRWWQSAAEGQNDTYCVQLETKLSIKNSSFMH